ncbi:MULTISPECIES: hypothetical protein [unclassified Candidatus Tisiphia]|jgi:hypothetical protein|uniref:hypothetical protein n=1 Tax=unclassified Candidatus Tisiphia TaxID=2996318 RepID=UPI001D5FA7D7|nr:hypothetical protein [Rickettsia endosymbiont of Sericostoma sp. HW-2014]
MPNPTTYTIGNLSDAREFLSEFHDPVILTNKSGSTRYYGMLVLDYIFKTLNKEFPQIVKIIVNVENDHPALFTAIKLNYQNITYTGESSEAKKLVALHFLDEQH